jgi:hypothetical protein
MTHRTLIGPDRTFADRPIRVLAAALLLVTLVVAAVSAVRQIHPTHVKVRTADAAGRSDGRPHLFRNTADQFADFVANIVPADATVRIIQPVGKPPAGTEPQSGPPGVCGNMTNTAVYWAFVYQLVPRASVCTKEGSWTVYFGVKVPSGPNVHRFSETMGVAGP